MNSAIEKHPLGIAMLEGNNKTVQVKANTYFAFKGEDIFVTRYKYILDCHETVPVKSEAHLLSLAKDSFGCVCEICGAKLYKESEERGVKVFRLKKQIIFVDNVAKKHFVCYQVNGCYKKAGLNMDVTTINSNSSDLNHISSRIKIPNLKELFNTIDYYNNLSESQQKYYYNNLEESYNDYIKAFIKRWIINEINKVNLVNFIFDFDKLKRYLAIINNSRLQNDFIIKIFEIIGIDQIKDRTFIEEIEND